MSKPDYYHDKYHVLSEKRLMYPLKDGVAIGREPSEEGVPIVKTNVPRIIVHHSLSGFEFGYGGSGPADLALNIIEWVLREEGHEEPDDYIIPLKQGHCFRLTYMLYQDFKWKFIATIPRDRGTIIPYKTIVKWIEKEKERFRNV